MAEGIDELNRWAAILVGAYSRAVKSFLFGLKESAELFVIGVKPVVRNVGDAVVDLEHHPAAVIAVDLAVVAASFAVA